MSLLLLLLLLQRKAEYRYMNTTKTRKKQNYLKIISNETVHTFHCYRNDIRQYITQELVCADNTVGLVNCEYIG